MDGRIASKKTDGRMPDTLRYSYTTVHVNTQTATFRLVKKKIKNHIMPLTSYSHSWSLPVQVLVCLIYGVNRQTAMDVKLAADKQQLHAL